MRDASQEKEFWRKRLRTATHPLNAIGVGFDWPLINKIHKDILSEHYELGMKVLDVGCGVGRIARWFPKEDYIGIDFVDEFIDLARKDNPEHSFKVLDIKEPLPFWDKEFDIAIGISLKHIFITGSSEEAWEKVLNELKRVSKKIILLPYGNNNPEEILKVTEIYEV